MTFDISDLLIIVSTLSVYSLLYMENPFSVWAENTLLGMGQAFALIMAFEYIKDYSIVPLNQGDYWNIIPVLLGLMTYFRYSKKYRWLSRLPLCISIGVFMGVSVRALMSGLLRQVTATFVPLFVAEDPIQTFGNIVVVVSVITTIFFFYFSREHTGVLGATTKISYYLLYISFGVYFANIFMGRVALFNGRMTELLAENMRLATVIVGAIILIITSFLAKKGLLKKSIGYE